MSADNHISLGEASHLIPGRPSLSSVHRWATRGIRGVKLQAVRVGGRLWTTREDVERFLAAQQLTVTPSHADAEAELSAEGL